MPEHITPDSERRRATLVGIANAHLASARRGIIRVPRLVEIRADADAARVCEAAAMALQDAAKRLRGEWPDG